MGFFIGELSRRKEERQPSASTATAKPIVSDWDVNAEEQSSQ